MISRRTNANAAVTNSIGDPAPPPEPPNPNNDRNPDTIPFGETADATEAATGAEADSGTATADATGEAVEAGAASEVSSAASAESPGTASRPGREATADAGFGVEGSIKSGPDAEAGAFTGESPCAEGESAVDDSPASEDEAWPNVPGSGDTAVLPGADTRGLAPDTARSRARGPAVDREAPAAPDAESLECDAEPASASSAAATPEPVAAAQPSPNANAAEPIRTPNRVESMTPLIAVSEYNRHPAVVIV